MPEFDSASGVLTVVEIVGWSIPVFVAIDAALRSPRRERMVWWLVGAVCIVIALDKTVDLQIRVYELGQDLIAAFAPGLRNDGSQRIGRLALLGLLFVGGCGGLYGLARADRRIDGPKRLSLLGLMSVMAYLGARLTPGLRDVLTPTAGRGVELICWLLVMAGMAWSIQAPGRGSASGRHRQNDDWRRSRKRG